MKNDEDILEYWYNDRYGDLIPKEKIRLIDLLKEKGEI